MTTQTITIRFEGQNADEVKKSFDSVESSAKGLGGTLGKVGEIAGGFLAANVIQGGVAKLTGFIGDATAAAKESIMVNAQLAQVLESTGGAANVSSKHIQQLSGDLEKHSLFEDEAIISGQNLLLTFTNIQNSAEGGSQIFDETTKIMLDMAQAMGTDAKGSAIQLGKALNDPKNGVSALTRVGVTFTAEQKKQIAAMQDAGDMAGAQTIILNELKKEFGGSAEAASNAAGAQEVYKDKMNDLKETIGAGLLPIQAKWMELQAAIVSFIAGTVIPIISSFINYIKAVIQDGDTMNDWLTHLPGPLQVVAKAFGDVIVVIQTQVIPAFDSVVKAIQPVTDAILGFIKSLPPEPLLVGLAAVIGTVLVAAVIALGVAIVGTTISITLAAAPFIAIAAAIAIAVAAVKLAIDNWDFLKAKTEEVFNSLPGPVQTAMTFIHDFIAAKIQGIIQSFNAVVEIVTSSINFIGAIIHGDWARAWQELKDIAGAYLDLLIGNIKAVFGNIPDIILGLAGEAAAAAGRFAEGIYNGIVNFLSDLPRKMGEIGRNAANSFINSISVAGISVGDVRSVLGGIPGFAVGTPFVPQDMLAYLHRGEAIIPANMNPYGDNGNRSVSVNIGSVNAMNAGQARGAGNDMAWAIMVGLENRGVRW